jgi:hypothetical protein
MGIVSTDRINIKQLKSLCKSMKLTNYSKLDKKSLVKLVNINLSIVKLQRFVRSKWVDGLCPISMDIVKYPCFAFKPKGFLIDKNKSRNHTSFIYYNLEPLVNYLLQSGDFRDPKTREPYTEETLKAIDICKTKNKIKGKSIFKSSLNKTIYRRKREREEDLVVLERCIDEVVSSIRITLETEQINDSTITLNSFHFPTFHRYFRNIYYKSSEYARQVLTNTIHIITGPNERPTQDPNNIKDFILQFMYTLDATYFE